MGGKRGASRRGEFTWDSFPTRKDADGWHCRKCGVALTGRKTAWCGKACLKQVLLLVDWSYIRRGVLRRDKWTCQLCGKPGHEVDHIVELTDGGSFHEWINLRCLCYTCHKAKTAFMKTSRAVCKKAGLDVQTLYMPDSIMKRHYFGHDGKIIKREKAVSM